MTSTLKVCVADDLRCGALRHPPTLGEVNKRRRAAVEKCNAEVCAGDAPIVSWDSTGDRSSEPY